MRGGHDDRQQSGHVRRVNASMQSDPFVLATPVAQFFQAMCKRREEEEAARLRALEGLTAEERAARLQAEEDARAHEESQMAHFQRLNKKLGGGGRAAVAVRGGRGRGARGGASRGSLK